MASLLSIIQHARHAIKSVPLATGLMIMNAILVQKILLLFLAIITSINRVLRLALWVITRTTSTKFAVLVNLSAQAAPLGIIVPAVSMDLTNLIMESALTSLVLALNSVPLDPHLVATIAIPHAIPVKAQVNSIVFRANLSISSWTSSVRLAKISLE